MGIDNFVIHKAVPSEFIINEEDRIVEGYLGDDRVDLDGHYITRAAYLDAIDEYRKWGNIRDMHGKPVGTVVSMGEKAWNHIAVRISDDDVWQKVKDKVYKGFSIGARVISSSWTRADGLTQDMFFGLPGIVTNAIKKANKVLRIDGIVLAEISIVDKPANPRAIILSYKSDGGNDIPILEEVYNARVELEKGDNQMELNENQTVEKDAQADNIEVTPVAEVDSEDTKSNSEEIVTKTDDTTQEDTTVVNEAEQFDAQLRFVELSDRLTQLESTIVILQSANEMVQKSLTDFIAKADALLNKAESNADKASNDSEVNAETTEDNTQKSDEGTVVPDATEDKVDVQKGETGDNSVSTSVSIDAITKALDAALEKYFNGKHFKVEEGQEIERNGGINKGDEGTVKVVEKTDFNQLPTTKKYNTVAEQIARQLAQQ